MAKDIEKAKNAAKDAFNRGQSKEHEIFYADGTPVLEEDGTQKTMTQAEWRARDKSLGYTRFEDVEPAEEPSRGEGEPVV